MRFDMVQVKKGGDGYLISNYLFRKERTRGEKTYLKCLEWRRHFCEARAIIENDEAVLTKAEHNHEIPDIEAYKFRASVRAAAIDIRNSRFSTPRVYENEKRRALDRVETEAEKEELLARLPTFRTLRGSVQHARSSTLPPNPDNRATITFDAFQEALQNGDGSSFVLADSGEGDENRILVFGNDRNLGYLARANEW